MRLVASTFACRMAVDRVPDVAPGSLSSWRRKLGRRAPCPGYRRVAERHKLRRDLGRCSEGGIVEDGKILIDRSAGFRGKSLVVFDPLLPVGVGLDQARIDCKSIPTDQPLPISAARDAFEHMAEPITLSETTMPVLGEGRVIRRRVCRTR
jgi:hypothetical protein